MVKYWPEIGKCGYLVWRYLLRRDDQEPAPWTPEGLERIKKLGLAVQVRLLMCVVTVWASDMVCGIFLAATAPSGTSVFEYSMHVEHICNKIYCVCVYTQQEASISIYNNPCLAANLIEETQLQFCHLFAHGYL